MCMCMCWCAYVHERMWAGGQRTRLAGQWALGIPLSPFPQQWDCLTLHVGTSDPNSVFVASTLGRLSHLPSTPLMLWGIHVSCNVYIHVLWTIAASVCLFLAAKTLKLLFVYFFLMYSMFLLLMDINIIIVRNEVRCPERLPHSRDCCNTLHNNQEKESSQVLTI